MKQLCLAFLSFCLLDPQLHATAYNGTLTADTYVNVSVATPPNEGTASSLLIAGNGAHTLDVGLVQFSLSALPGGTTASSVTKATLTVYVNQISFGTGTSATLSIYPVTAGTWNETSATDIAGYSNTAKPQITASSTAIASAAVTSTSAGTFVTFDVTKQVESWITTPSSNLGLTLKVGTTNVSVSLDSKESPSPAHPATLEVDLNTVATTPILALPQTTSSTNGVLDINGIPFLQSYGSGSTFLGSNSGNFTLTGYENTGIGFNAFLSDTSGSENTAIGVNSLRNNTQGATNVGLGSYTLYYNTTGQSNTASGQAALYFNTADGNTADGFEALFNNTTGKGNVATGYQALYTNSVSASFGSGGNYNTADGYQALYSNGIDSYGGEGHDNTADGYQALHGNIGGIENTASGSDALFSNSSGVANSALGTAALYYNAMGSDNVAVGSIALEENNAYDNVGIGCAALQNATSGNYNIGLGFSAGAQVTTGDANIEIGNEGTSNDSGVIRIGNADPKSGLGTQNATFIAGISSTTVTGAAVYINSNGQLGVLTSSRKFKDNIKNMGQTSDVLLSLQPVTYHYKPQVESSGMAQFGLVAEDVEKVDPDLVIHDKEGKPYTVRYEAVNAMLLNEFLKEHKTVETQQARMQAEDDKVHAQADELAAQQKELDLLKAQINSIQSNKN